MGTRQADFDRIRPVLEDAEEPLTAREILNHLDEDDFESAHQIATVLGTHARYGNVEVIQERPYRYQI